MTSPNNKVYATHAAALAASAFPGAVDTPLEFRDLTASPTPESGTFTIPASSPYTWKIPVPIDLSTLTLTIGGTSKTVTTSPASSTNVNIEPLSGTLTFHASHAGLACAYTVTPYATALGDNELAIIQGRLQATQTALLGITGGITTNTIYIDKTGNDTTGNGSRALPFLTITHAVAAIGTPSATNLYVLDIGPGVYDEAVVLTKSYVTIRGAGPDATVIRHDNPASASSGLYAGPLKIHSGTWGASHSGDTALAGIVLRDITLKNQPTVDDGDVYPALTIGDPTRALYDSAITTPGAGIILQNVHLRGYRDTLTICGRADILIRDSDIRGTLDTVFPIGANLTLINTRIENTTSTGANALIYACGTETLTLHGCLLLCDSSGSTGAISIRTDPRDTSAITINITDTHIGTTGAPGTLRPLLLTVNNSTTSTINIGKGNTYLDTGHRSAPSGGSITINDIGALPNTGTMGDRYNPGVLKARSTGSAPPQVILETLSPSSNKQPQLVTRAADLDGTTPSAINPTYTPVAATSSGLILGEWIAQTYQPNGAWATSCRIRATQAATAGNGDNPGKWTFDTCADGDSTLTTRFTINADGTLVAAVSLESPLFKFPADSTFVTTLAHTTSTANRTITFPNADGTVAVAATTPLSLSAAGALTIQAADASHNGYLSSTDWSTFNSKGSGTVTAVSVATANGVSGSSSGGATPALTLTLGAITPSSVASAGAVSGTTITASAQVGCEVYHSTTQSLTGGADTAILFDSEDSDVGTCHDIATNKSRLTASVAGTYLVTASIYVNDDFTDANFYSWIAKNGAHASTDPRYANTISTSSTGGLGINLSWVITLAANDYLEIYVKPDNTTAAGSATVSLRNRASFKRLY